MPMVLNARADELRGRTHWIAGALAGLVAGAVFMMVEMAMVMMFMGESPWAPPRMMAAMLLGKGVLPPPATFDMGIMMAAMAVHVPLSAIYGLAGAWLIHRFGWGGGVVVGALLGLAIYIVNFHFVAPALFPWFVEARNWISAVTHLVFGAVLGIFYVALRKPKRALRAPL